MYKKLLLGLVLFIPFMIVVHSADALEFYGYDVTGRLIKVTYNDGSTISYAYDASGNRLSSAPTAALNQAPVANDDAATTSFEVAVDISVLGNDTDADGTLNVTSVAIVANATNGTTSINGATGVVTYTPNAGYSGPDSFTYTVNDDQGAGSNVASVSITIEAQPPNQAPVANNDSVSTSFDSPIVISVLSNDTDADGSMDATSVAIGTAAQNGTTTVAANGQVTYTPNAGFSGADSFTYTVMDNDGDISNSATVSITVNALPTPPGNNASSGGGSMSVGLLILLLAGLGRRFFRKQPLARLHSSSLFVPSG